LIDKNRVRPLPFAVKFEKGKEQMLLNILVVNLVIFGFRSVKRKFLKY
jgi:hypothetical protein